jgi:hypothetical protein
MVLVKASYYYGLDCVGIALVVEGGDSKTNVTSYRVFLVLKGIAHLVLLSCYLHLLGHHSNVA